MNLKSIVRLPAKAGAWYVASSAVIKLCGMSATPYFTRVMSPEEYGRYSLYMSWLAMLSVLTTLGLGGSAIYRGMQKLDSRGNRILSSAIGLALGSLALFSAVAVLFPSGAVRLLGLSLQMVYLLILQIALDSVITLYLSRSRYVYGYRLVIGVNLGAALLSLGLSMLLSRFTEPTATLRATALLIATAVFALPLFVTAITRDRRIFSRRVWGFLLRFNLPLLPHLLAGTLMTNMDKVLISRIVGESAVAGFSVAYSLGAGMSFITTGLISALSPWIMRKIAQGKQDRVADVTLKLSALVAVGSLGVLTLAPEVLAFLAPSSYSSALPSVYPITVTAAVSFISSVTATALIRAERTGLLSLCSIVGAAVNVAANLLLLPISFNGAALAHFAAAVASLTAGIILTRRLSGGSVVKALPSATVIAVSALLSFILYAIRDDLVSRLIILALLGLAAIACLFSLKDDVIEKDALKA